MSCLQEAYASMDFHANTFGIFLGYTVAFVATLGLLAVSLVTLAFSTE